MEATLTKKQKVLVYIVFILPIIVLGIIFIPYFVISWQEQGVIYAFRTIDSPWPYIALLAVIFLELLLSGIYLFEENASKNLKWFLFTVGMGIFAMSIVLSISFGHITNAGISYRAYKDLWINRTTVWSQVDDTISLRIIYHTNTKGGGSGYHCWLIIRDISEPQVSFKISFADTKERQALLLTLGILNQNHKNILTYIDPDTLNLILDTKDKEIIDFFKQVQGVSKSMTITSRYDFKELE